MEAMGVGVRRGAGVKKDSRAGVVWNVVSCSVWCGLYAGARRRTSDPVITGCLQAEMRHHMLLCRCACTTATCVPSTNVNTWQAVSQQRPWAPGEAAPLCAPRAPPALRPRWRPSSAWERTARRYAPMALRNSMVLLACGDTYLLS
jgi:hypothetical protein